MTSQPEATYVEITDRGHAAAIHRWIGQIEVTGELEAKAKEFDRLPGFGLALAILQKEVAESRSLAITENLRAVSRAGIKIEDTRHIELESGQKGSLRLKVTMLDLADMAGTQ